MANARHGKPLPPRPTASRSTEPDDRSIPRIDGLEIIQDLRLQRITWRLQRISWLGIALILLAAVLGLFGSGPLSHTSAVHPGSPLRVEYERFGRQQRSMILRLHLGPDSTRGAEARVWFDSAYIEAVEVVEISPPPVRSETGHGRIHYTFAITKPGRPTTITLEITPERIGWLSAQTGLDIGPPIQFQQWIYP